MGHSVKSECHTYEECLARQYDYVTTVLKDAYDQRVQQMAEDDAAFYASDSRSNALIAATKREVEFKSAEGYRVVLEAVTYPVGLPPEDRQKFLESQRDRYRSRAQEMASHAKSLLDYLPADSHSSCACYLQDMLREMGHVESCLYWLAFLLRNAKDHYDGIQSCLDRRSMFRA